MLTIKLHGKEFYDEEQNRFIHTKDVTLNLEHSLIAISKWETITNKPFLTKERRATEEMILYIKCMTINKNVDENCYLSLTDEDITTILQYIEKTMTATKLPKPKPTGASEIITSELIYYWMVAATIPFETEKWNIERLMTLISIYNIKNAPPKKMSKNELINRNRELNARCF